MTALLSISDEQIQKYVADSLLNAGIGESIKKSISEILTSRYNNPVDKAISIYVQEVAIELVKTKFAPEINAIIETAIKGFIEKKGFEAIFKSLSEKLEKLDDYC